MINAAKYEILYAQKDGEYDAKAVGGIRTKVIRAGDSLEIEAFPLLRCVSAEARQEAKRRRNPAAMERINAKNRVKRFRRLMEENFDRHDLHITLTYDYGFEDRTGGDRAEILRAYQQGRYPTDDDEARRDIQNFIRRVKRAIKRRGREAAKLNYMYVIEATMDKQAEYDANALPPHYHFHMVMSGDTGLTRDEIEALWGRGYCNADRLDTSSNGLAALAKYLTKGRKFSQRWGHSKGLREPRITITDRAISRRRAETVARDVQAEGREIFEAIYKGYRMTEAEVRYSDFTAGAYIYARMRKRN